MDMSVDAGGVLVRLGPGEDLHDAVHAAFDAGGRAFPVVTSCIGSLSRVDYGVAACDDGGIPGPGMRFQRSDDALEIGSIHGHVGVDDDDRPSSHLHGVIFDAFGQPFGGHIFEAKVLITIEFALLGRGTTGWDRVHRPVSGSPPLPLLVPRTLGRR